MRWVRWMAAALCWANVPLQRLYFLSIYLSKYLSILWVVGGVYRRLIWLAGSARYCGGT